MSVHPIKPNLEDTISISAYCREDGTVLLTAQGDDTLSQFPSLHIVKSSWRLAVRKLINSVSGMAGKELSIMRVTKFWVPDSSPVFHVIYKNKCTLNEKKAIKLQNSGVANLKWYTLDQVIHMSLTGLLSSPELVEYVLQILQPRNFYPLSTDPEASKEGFDMLNEIVEKNVLVDVEAGFLTPQEQLLKTAHFGKGEQKKIYKEYLLKTFPNLFMNRIQFDNFMLDLGWKKEEWPGLFSCADVSARQGMSFRDFLLFLAATEPETPHGSGSGEIRCQYIFRYFDKNRDNILDFSELRALLIAISNVKGGIKPKDQEKLIDSLLTDTGLTPKDRLSMNTFVKKVGELKLRGTSSIFRSKISIFKLIVSPGEGDNQQLNVRQGTKKQASFFPSASSVPLWKGTMSNLVMGRSSDELNKSFVDVSRSKNFVIATHAIRLNRAGLLEDVKPIDRVSHGKSISMGDQDYFIRLPSLQYFDDKLPANELLAALSFFTNEITGTSKNRKQPYSWGKFDMHRLASLLLIMCDKCIKILEKEPRMLQLSSPLYVLGDLHGNFPDLMAFEQILWGLGLSLSPCSLLFLGDYVDRGPSGVEVVAYLVAQKVKNPQKIFLLRGNHEIRTIQKNFTFFSECQRKFGDEMYFDVWNTINKVFDVMPLAAVVDAKIFCCHGGIPPPWLCSCIDQINTIPNPLSTPDEESLLAWEIMWNDPIKTEQMTPLIEQEMNANEGFAVNIVRKTGRYFSSEALDFFLKRNELSHVIRAHEVKTAGFQVQLGGRLLTVFSSSGYCGGPNEAACMFISGDKIRVFRINTT